MKLLFVHDRLGEFGGAEANLHLTARELRQRGHSLALLYCQATGRNHAGWQRTFEDCFTLGGQEAGSSVQDVLQRWQPELIYLHNLSDLDAIETLLNSGVPVVRMVHDHSLYCMRSYKYNYFTRRICTRAASPFCVFPCLASIGRDSGSVLGLKWNSYAQKRREIRLNQRCDRVLVYSAYVKEELLRNGFDPAKIEVWVPLPLGEDANQVSSFSPKNLILFAGQLIRGKGVDVLLKALAKVKEPFQCAILGEGNHRPYCQELCHRLGLSNRVLFHGYLPQSQSRDFYLEASAFVVSSLWPEPFGLVGPEAMRCGLPVVAFDAGGIREWLQDGENGFLVPWGNTDRFAERLDQLLRNKEEAKLMGRRAQAWVQRFDSHRQMQRLEHLFQGLLCPVSTPKSTTFPLTEQILPAYG